jgi:glycosyltransferase involved in cell wall biosynthesis
MLSIIVPVYNEEKNILFFLEKITHVLSKISNYEIIFCLDPSTDQSEKVILESIKINTNIKLIKFSRRFGQSNCIYAGIKNANGKVCLIIDIDLQDPPELIGQMYDKILQGNDCVYAKRIKRNGENKIRVGITNLYYYLLNKFSEYEIPKNAGEFRMFSEKIINHIKISNENNFFLRGMTSFIGFKQDKIEFERKERLIGESKYIIGSYQGALTGIMNFTNLIPKIAIIFAIINLFIFFIFIFTNYIIAFIAISQFVLGFLIYFIFKYLIEINHLTMKRPAYIIDEKINF